MSNTRNKPHGPVFQFNTVFHSKHSHHKIFNNLQNTEAKQRAGLGCKHEGRCMASLLMMLLKPMTMTGHIISEDFINKITCACANVSFL